MSSTCSCWETSGPARCPGQGVQAQASKMAPSASSVTARHSWPWVVARTMRTLQGSSIGAELEAYLRACSAYSLLSSCHYLALACMIVYFFTFLLSTTRLGAGM